MSRIQLRRVGLRPLFIAAVSLVVMTTSVLLGWWLLRDRSQQLLQEAVAKGISVSRTLAINAEYDVLVGHSAGQVQLIEGLRHDPDLRYAIITDGVLEVAGPSERVAPTVTGQPQLLRETDGVKVLMTPTTEGELLIIEAPVTTVRQMLDREALRLGEPNRAHEELEQLGQVRVMFSQTRVEQGLNYARKVVASVTAAVVALGLLLTVTLSTIIVSPVLQLAAASRRIAAGDMSVNVPEGGARELAELTDAFNHMSEALKQRDEALKQNAAALLTQAEALEHRNQELHLSQSQLRTINAELLHASRLKSAFLASMSHELRTPLNSIIGYTECMLDGLDGPVTQDQTESLERVQRNGRHLLGLIGDILDLSKIESGKMELSQEEINLADLTGECLAMARPLARGKALKLRLEVSPDAPALLADAGRTRQILINLISNAIKFSDEGEVLVTVGGDLDGAELVVRDTGRGIPKARLEDIFVEFQQLEGPTSPGTGLGLAITRRLVELMGGTLQVESEVGVGSAFTVWLPLRPGV